MPDLQLMNLLQLVSLREDVVARWRGEADRASVIAYRRVARPSYAA